MDVPPTVARHRALADLLAALRCRKYQFVTPTPTTHAIVIGRDSRRQGRSLTDILGWSLPFVRENVDPEVLAHLQRASALSPGADGLWRSTIRVSSLHNHLFIHSAFPTNAHDAVFFGPDSYRFADAITAELSRRGLGPAASICDIGTGSGVGAIVAGAAWTDASITMTDINPKALEFARANAAAAGVTAQGIVSYDLSDAAGAFDLILANPPYIIDPAGRAYRHGGCAHGSEVALGMTRMALARLAPSGRFLLYSGSAIVSGEDRLRERLERLAHDAQCALSYREIDPDVFGEELIQPAYGDVDRIAVVAAVFTGQGELKD